MYKQIYKTELLNFLKLNLSSNSYQFLTRGIIQIIFHGRQESGYNVNLPYILENIMKIKWREN